MFQELVEAREAIKFCNSFNRLPAIIDLWNAGRVANTDWMRILGEEWSACDNIAQHKARLLRRTPFGQAALGQWKCHAMMDDEEMEAYRRLPSRVTIYRGCYANNRAGLSWSLDHSLAATFPTLHRYRQQDGEPILIEATTTRSKIVALKLDRGEVEIITYRPRHVSTSKLRAYQ